jgi:hypothetical protein
VGRRAVGRVRGASAPSTGGTPPKLKAPRGARRRLTLTNAGQSGVLARGPKLALRPLLGSTGNRLASVALFRGVLGNCFLAPLYRCIDPHRRVTPNNRGVSGLSGRYHRVSRLPNAFCVPTTASGKTHHDQGTCEHEPHVSPPPGHRSRITARMGGPPWVSCSQFLGPGTEAAVTLLTPPGALGWLSQPVWLGRSRTCEG